MRRRTFLEATVVSAGSLAIGAGAGTACSSENPDGGGGNSPDEVIEVSPAHFPQSVASGDPKPDSVVLWTRLEDSDRPSEDLSVSLEVARDETFTLKVAFDATLTAEADFDHCVKVRVAHLDPGAHYYYRFLYTRADGTTVSSRIGRTKTAPARDADVTVRFGVASCQDYIGRYYHPYRHMAERDLDFFVHLGDYIYETSGDPGFQGGDAARSITFRDEASAIAFDGGKFYAAKALSNYRDLYQIYRSDRDLQRVHELFPMIAIWDDHEFSDDSYGEHGTYFDGEENEHDAQRRRSADQAWFEYMPVDFAAGPEFRFDPSKSFPDNLKIYRDFEFGKHVHLVMTDLRRYRPDHIIAEDAFPGAIAATQEQIEAHLDAMPALATPYIELDAYYAKLLKDHATQLEIDVNRVEGKVSASYINDAIAKIQEDGGPEYNLVDVEDPRLQKGIAYHQLMKSSQYSMVGARALIVKDAFDAVSKIRYAETKGASENILGDTQEAWFLDTFENSSKTWKVWGNGFTFMPRVVDLTQMGLPPAYSQIFYLSGEDWDGAPNRRDELLTKLGNVGNVVAVTGDIHAFFTGSPRNPAAPGQGIVEFVCGSISSGTYKELLVSKAMSTPSLRAIGAQLLAENVHFFLTDPGQRPNPHLAHARVDGHGYGVLEVSGDKIVATQYSTDEENAVKHPDSLSESLDEMFTEMVFVTKAGSPDVYLLEDGTEKRWDAETMSWV